MMSTPCLCYNNQWYLNESHKISQHDGSLWKGFNGMMIKTMGINLIGKFDKCMN